MSYEIGAIISTHAPAGGATGRARRDGRRGINFYSRPCGRGDAEAGGFCIKTAIISTQAPAGGATPLSLSCGEPLGGDFYSRPCGRGDGCPCLPNSSTKAFLLTPLREGRPGRRLSLERSNGNFYSRPCGRGDVPPGRALVLSAEFLLTPLREGRQERAGRLSPGNYHFYSRPCGRGDAVCALDARVMVNFYSRPCGRGDTLPEKVTAAKFLFLLTPLREGRPLYSLPSKESRSYFYSRPCGRGDPWQDARTRRSPHFYSRPCGRGDVPARGLHRAEHISTHAPAGGAT